MSIPATSANVVAGSRPDAAAPAGLIPEADRIPLRQKLMFSLGVNTDYVATGLMMGVLWMPYFNIGMGIRPALLGMVLMILRGWDAVVDPIMGNLSDNTRTRWGRRRPFMAAGAVMTGALYPLFWYLPAGLGETGRVVYLSAVGMVFFVFFSMWSMPYYGMQLELTPNYDERTRLASWMAFFGTISNLAGGWMIAILTSAWFANPQTGKGDIVLGMRTGCWFIAAAIVVFGLLPAVFVKERYYQAESSTQARESFWQSLKESARCRPLWSLIGISFFLVLGMSSVSSLGQYVNIYYLFHGDLAASSVVAGWKSTATTAVCLVSLPLWTWLGERFDKKTMVASLLTLSMVGHLLNFYCLRPDLPYLQIIPGLFESSGIFALWLFLPSMKADAADHDELHTTRRREGSINSFYSWFIKASGTCAAGLGGWVLELSRFDVKLAAQPPEVLRRMLGLYLILPVVIWAVALWIALAYPLHRSRMAEIRSLLERRRGRI